MNSGKILFMSDSPTENLTNYTLKQRLNMYPKKNPNMVKAGIKAAKVKALNKKINHAVMVLAGFKAAKARIQNGG